MLSLHDRSRVTRLDDYTCLITCVLALFSAVQVVAINTYKMDLLCGKEISLDDENIYTGIVRFRFSTFLESNKNCCFILSSTISANHISFYFSSLKIGPSCDNGYLVAQDGKFLASAKIRGFPDRLCGDDVSVVAADRYYSWGSNVRFQFIGTEKTQLNAGFEIVFTSFDDGPCTNDHYRCDNGHCIMSDLRCSGLDPCGDGSDCKPEGLSGGHIAGIAIGCFIGLLMIIFLIIFLFCCRKKSICRGSTSNTRSYTARVAFRNQSRHLEPNSGDGNQTATPDPVLFMYGMEIFDHPPPYEQVVNEGGYAFPSGSDFVFKDLPTYEEATTGEISVSVNK
ncbi:hypothetical protein CHS0354_026990 [Potamilus streckersoni]|uniref:CUB domain-containing protein n=1 Tax=Potamilus streckersoni TaxID=2493646 RepID=A0AAE0SCI3_9BIVA|nr:hypothetical protein CHS0354_026990 [Potamilus streckersoni]